MTQSVRRTIFKSLTSGETSNLSVWGNFSERQRNSMMKPAYHSEIIPKSASFLFHNHLIFNFCDSLVILLFISVISKYTCET